VFYLGFDSERADRHLLILSAFAGNVTLCYWLGGPDLGQLAVTWRVMLEHPVTCISTASVVLRPYYSLVQKR